MITQEVLFVADDLDLVVISTGSNDVNVFQAL